MTRLVTLGAALVVLGLAGCGGDDGIKTDPGSGTMTLLVDAEADYDNETNTADLRVNIKKAGANLDGAAVRITSEIGEVILVGSGGGDYRGVQSGWSDEGYILAVEVKDAQGNVTDGLKASLAAPVRVVLEPSVSTCVRQRPWSKLPSRARLVCTDGEDRGEATSCSQTCRGTARG